MTTRNRTGEAAAEEPPRAARTGRSSLFWRAIGVWLALLGAAFANGALRELALALVLGAAVAGPVSALILVAVITGGRSGP
jgi:hypothetical protein